jgi:hypothetical protein
MLRMELHDEEVDNGVAGTLAACIGRRDGIDYLYQVEMHLHEAAPQGVWRRAYILNGQVVISVWDRPLKPSSEELLAPLDMLRHVARLEDYPKDGWQPSFVDESATKIATGYFGIDADTLLDGQAWAERQLADKTVATAIITRDVPVGRIFGAWERDANGTVVMIARSPEHTE